MKKTDVCPGNLAEGFDRYCPRCIRQLFDGKRVSPIMDFDYDADDADLSSAINRILVSGVQEKLSAILSDGKIMLTPLGARGRYIIKPAPAYKHLRFRDQIPANEHLTMQIARQVYKITTAENGIVFFRNGEMAYITKRFDYDLQGNKIKQEDFASLARKSVATHGRNFKYTDRYMNAEPILRVGRLQLSIRQRRCSFEEFFVAADARRRLFVGTGLRPIEYFDSCSGRRLRLAGRFDPAVGVLGHIRSHRASVPCGL